MPSAQASIASNAWRVAGWARVQVRQGAGLLLKNNIKAQYNSLSDDYKSFIKVRLLPSPGALAHFTYPVVVLISTVCSARVQPPPVLPCWHYAVS